MSTPNPHDGHVPPSNLGDAGLEFVLAAARFAVGQQVSQFQTLDTKIQLWSAASTAVFLATIALAVARRPDPDLVVILLLVGIVAGFASVVLLGLIASWPRNLNTGPRVTLLEESTNLGASDPAEADLLVLKAISQAYLDSARENQKLVSFKVRAARVSMLLTIAVVVGSLVFGVMVSFQDVGESQVAADPSPMLGSISDVELDDESC